MSSYDFYVDTFGGDMFVDSIEFTKYANRAYMILDIYSGGMLDKITAPALVKKVDLAVCIEAEYLYLNGIDITSTGVTEGGFTVGKVHVSGGSSHDSSAWGSYISSLALDLLAQAGVSRHLAVAVEPFAPYWG